MSRVDRLRQAIDAFSGRGADLEADADLLAPDFELHQSSSIIDTAGVFRGPDAVRESLSELSESFEDMTYEAERYLEAPGGEVVVLIHTTGRGRGSGWRWTTTSPGCGPFATTRRCGWTYTRSRPTRSRRSACSSLLTTSPPGAPRSPRRP